MTVSSYKSALADLYDRFAAHQEKWADPKRFYHRYVGRLVHKLVPERKRILDVGCGNGDLLDSLRPDVGVGVDLSNGMVELARRRHPALRFQQGEAETLVLDERFDTVMMVNVVGQIEDVYEALKCGRSVLSDDGRLVIVYYNHLWEPLLRLASMLRLRAPLPFENWLPLADVENLLELTSCDVVRRGRRMLCPMFIPGVSWLLNTWLAPLPLINRLCLVEYVVARSAPGEGVDGERSLSEQGPTEEVQAGRAKWVPTPIGTTQERSLSEQGPTEDVQAGRGKWVPTPIGTIQERSLSEQGPTEEVQAGRGKWVPTPIGTCSIVIPTKDERGNIEAAITRTRELGAHTEFIFIDGHSTDGTVQEIERIMAAYPDKDIRFAFQDGKGKADAVRKGFDMATGDVLMILDSDLTMPPEDLPKYFEVIASGRAEFVNGCRLVYPMEKEAMRLLNKMANHIFGWLFSWLMEQRVRDTLCGTKVLSRKDYERIAANRAYFGEFDPFGDFDLLFGAARLNLKIVDLPIRYRERTYGEIKISRFRHGLLLMKMSVFAARKLKFF